MRVLGVHLAGGVAHLALVDGKPVPISPARITPSDSEVPAVSLKTFSETFRSEARRHRVTDVAVALPLQRRDWVYTHAFRRVSLEAAVMIVCAEERMTHHTIEQHGALKLVGSRRLGKGEKLQDIVALLLAAPHAAAAAGPAWKERSIAMLVALSLREPAP
jgi:hypothetical protein